MSHSREWPPQPSAVPPVDQVDTVRDKPPQESGFEIQYKMSPTEAVQVLCEHFHLDSQDIRQGAEPLPKAVQLGIKRSSSNVAKSIEAFVSWAAEEGVDPAIMVDKIKQLARENQESVEISYYVGWRNAATILQEGELKNLYEFKGADQEKRRKASDDSATETMHKRKAVDEALGWSDPSKVYHLATESRHSIDDPEGPASNYGAIRFSFDFKNLVPHATFTEGDSMNPGHLPSALSNSEKTGAGFSDRSMSDHVEKRQISAEHVPIVQALFELANRKDRGQNNPIFLRYVEAQVGEISGRELMQNLRGITINKLKAFREAKREQWKREDILELQRRLQGGEYEGIDRREAQLKFEMEIFERDIAKLKRMCEENNISYQEIGGEELREALK